MKNKLQHTQILMKSLYNYLNNTDIKTDTPDLIILESYGYKTDYKLIEDAFLGRITNDRFEQILNDHFNLLHEGKFDYIMNKVISMLESSIKFLTKFATKSISALLILIKKIVEIIIKFSSEHPVMFVIIVALIVMLITTTLSHASVIGPNGKMLTPTQINMTIGSLEDISRAGNGVDNMDLLLKIGEFQKELIDARDNIDHVVDLQKDGIFKSMFDSSWNYILGIKNDLNNTPELEQFYKRIVSIGNTMTIK